jgi:DNA-binding transcriptional LysR family regulator
MDLQNIDLNLMVAFEALMAERSVSGAAARLGVSQPAMSATLARLRSLFDDELLVRTGRDMLPTSRASDLAGPVGEALAKLRVAIEPRACFDPASSRRSFTLSGGDYAATVLLPQLATRVRDEAPHIDLRFRFVEKDQIFELLDSDAINLALGVYPAPPKRFVLRGLLEERFVCVARRDHPALQGGLTREAFVAVPHVLVTERGDATGAVDDALRRHGLERRIALTVPYVLVLRSLLPDSDFIATIGLRAAKILMTSSRLTLYEPPIDLATWRLEMLWSRQQDSDTGLKWLRDAISSIAANA